MGRQSFSTISRFVCPECETEIPLPRIHGKQREKNHTKDIYCFKCNKVQKFKEVKYNEFHRTMSGERIG